VSDKDQKVRFLERIEVFFQKLIPSRKLLIKTNGRTHFIDLKSSTQVGLSVLLFCLVAWSIIAIAIVAMDNLGAGNFKEQALRDKENYQLRLMSLANERDLQLDLSKQNRVKFDEALTHISLLQEALIDGEINAKS